MRLLFYTDVHWSQYSSIVRSRDRYFSTRLDNLIRSVNWAEELAAYTHCDGIVVGGDFFDNTTLNSEEISALQHIRWAPTTHIFLTGNHETNVMSLGYSTADLFKLCPNARVISSPEVIYPDNDPEVQLCFLPYVFEQDRQPLESYFEPNTRKHRIVFSHNDLKDVNYGGFISVEGFELNDIKNNCDLFLNGHIHHSGWVAEKVFNGGNLTGQNFTEDASKFEHIAIVVDTETLTITPYANPYAFNFYKLDCTGIESESAFRNILDACKTNAVVTIKVTEEFIHTARNILESHYLDKVMGHRFIVDYKPSTSEASIETLQTVDYLQKFETYVRSNIGDSDIIREELNAVMV